MSEIRRLAIVNRAEPAIRALTTVAELNGSGSRRPITTIAVYTDPDASAWFVREADEAIALGPATFVDPVDQERKSSYLDEARLVELLRAAEVDAAWVGWGFLAERATFAERCEAAGIAFVGPGSAAIRLLGDKVAAKRLAEAAGVPVIAWSGGPVADLPTATAAAERLGYPVVLKAAAGGGGRGIRVVREPADLAAALSAATAEARLAFGDPTVFLESLVAAARHVEVQVIADQHGTTWAVGLRDCTIQRRHQKIIEESGSTALTATMATEIRAAAVRLMAAAGYVGAGTVEFLVDPATGQWCFLEVNTRLQVEHPVTEATTGLDLVRLQLQVAEGARLDGDPPPERGYAIEARLCAEDPEQGFAPAPGRVALLDLPSGAGIRVDPGVREGDVIAPEFDSMIAKIIASGRDRGEALARLRRALRQTTVVVEGGTTNVSLLRGLLDRPEMASGQLDNHWLDDLARRGEHLPAVDAVALLVAATEAYEADDAADRATFHARAARGRPEVPAEAGHGCVLRYRGGRYALRTFRTGPTTYRVDGGSAQADVEVDGVDAWRRRVTVGGRRHRVVTATDGPVFRVEVDGAAHTLVRDDGGVVRSGWPAFVVSVLAQPGQTVAEGDPLVVLESMKMEATITAPYAGEVTAVAVAANVQVAAGEPLLRLRAVTAGPETATGAAAVELRGLLAPEPAGTPPCERIYGALRAYLLGYDLDPATERALFARQRRLGEIAPPADPGLLRCEDGLLDLFADVAALYRPRTDTAPATGSAQQHLLSYLQWLDPDRAGLPEGFRERLERALRRYGIAELRRTPALERAVVWMFRSFRRVEELVPVVAGILQRRLAHRPAITATATASPEATAELRARLDRLAAAGQGRHQVVADLARDVRFAYLDEPLLAAVIDEEYATVESHLAALRARPRGPDRARRIDRLVRSPQPLRGLLLRHWRDSGEAVRAVLLEVYVRRHYRAHDLTRIAVATTDGYQLCGTEYVSEGRPVYLVAAYAPLDELPGLSRAIGVHLKEYAGADHAVVVDVTAWRPGERDGVDALAATVGALLEECAFGRPLTRLDITVTSTDGAAPEHLRTQHLTYGQRDGAGFVEDPLYRNLHPMLAERMDLWRLSNFQLCRLPSAEDVYLFHGVAHDNPADHRLFALAEVRDLTPAVDANGAVSYPRLELIGLRALSAMREARASFGAPGRDEADRPQANRIVLYVRPVWRVQRTDWVKLARSLAPLGVGADLEKVVLRVRVPTGGRPRETVLHVEGLDRGGITVRERPPRSEPVRPLTPYRQKVLRAHRFGAPYPYEIVKMLAPDDGVLGRFPRGRFVEHDLDADGGLRPVHRLPGLNTANVVVGLITNDTVAVPEGMTRVALLGDPTRGLGNLAEPECRRIIAALDLAERLGVPVEWFALSSGARIAMDSGTENMDWIAAVLRRIIEFTQGGGELNVVVTGVNVGAQPYWNAEATMLMHTRGILVMTPQSAMVLTGKQALDFSGGVSAEDNLGIGGFDRVMGPNGQAQYWAPTLEDACDILLRHYEHTYVVAGERFPRRVPSIDPVDRDVRRSPHPTDDDLRTVGDVLSQRCNPDRKRPFDIRAVLRSVTDQDALPLERWAHWQGGETAVVWDARIAGIPVCLLGLESRTVPRRGFVPADGPTAWTPGTLFPQSARKLARAVNAASGNRPLVVLANLSGFDGSPDSMRHWQLEYGAEIGRAVTNFRGPIIFVVVSRYHGGAFVVFSKQLNAGMEVAAIDGSYASVIGGAPAAATVFAREVKTRTERDPQVAALREELRSAPAEAAAGLRARLAETLAAVRAQKLGEVADEFDAVHTVQRAQAVGSVDRIIAARDLRPYLVDALERGMAAPTSSADGGPVRCPVATVTT